MEHQVRVTLSAVNLSRFAHPPTILCFARPPTTLSDFAVRPQHVWFHKSRKNAASFVEFRPGFLVKFLLQETGLMVRGWALLCNYASRLVSV